LKLKIIIGLWELGGTKGFARLPPGTGLGADSTVQTAWSLGWGSSCLHLGSQVNIQIYRTTQSEGLIKKIIENKKNINVFGELYFS
jgi:hypothetical protein